jgi:predicted dehydrogenase
MSPFLAKGWPVTSIGVAMIGSGMIALANHLPGFALCPQARVVALCDTDPAALEKAAKSTGISATYTDYHELLKRPDVNAVVIATPNFVHAPIALAAIAAGKHVLCEKPIAMDLAEALAMYRAAEAKGVRHMTAFTYRFVPAMRYMAHLVHSGKLGRPYHFRAQRFQDWGDRALGWRQVKKTAATGEMGDMLSHRIDFGHYLLGPMARVVGHTKRYIDQRGGKPADVEDWVAMLADFDNGATGVLESSKLATGRGEGGRSRDYCEVNGEEGTAIYELGRPNEIQIGRKGGMGLEVIPVPQEFLKHPASSRDVNSGDPVVTFRYDQDVEFIDAIVHNRPCQPSFLDGVRVQAVMEAILESEHSGKWVNIKPIEA